MVAPRLYLVLQILLKDLFLPRLLNCISAQETGDFGE